MRQVAGFAFIVSTLFLVACSTAHHQASTKETKIVVLRSEQAGVELKKYEVDGWRCVGVITGTPISPMDIERGYMLERTND